MNNNTIVTNSELHPMVTIKLTRGWSYSEATFLDVNIHLENKHSQGPLYQPTDTTYVLIQQNNDKYTMSSS